MGARILGVYVLYVKVIVWALLGMLALSVLPVVVVLFAGLIRRFQIWRTRRELQRMGFVGSSPFPAETRPIWPRVGAGLAVLVAVIIATSLLPGGPWGRTLASTEGSSLSGAPAQPAGVPPSANAGSSHPSSQQPTSTHSAGSSHASPASMPSSASSASQAADPGSDAGAPSTVTARSKSATAILVQWASVTGAASYDVERSTDTVSWKTVHSADGDQTQYTDDKLSSGTTYYYRVAAIVEGQDVARSDVVSATTTGDTSTAPVWISSTPSITSVDLAWSDVDGATGYQIERSLDGTSWSPLGTTGQGVTTYTDTGLTSATTYYYRVSALTSDGGSSVPSTSLAVTTDPAGPTTSDANAFPSQAPTAP
jgi:hypothetical protein